LVSFSPNGQLLVSASHDNTVRLWDPSTGSSRGTLEGHSHWVNAVAFSPGGQLLASASYDNNIRLWDLSTAALRGTLEGHSRRVNAVAFSPDGQLLASASDDDTVRLWDPSTGASRATLSHWRCVNSVAFSADGQLLASGNTGIVRLWDPSTGASRGTLDPSCCLNHLVHSVAFSPDGQLLAAAFSNYYDHKVSLWDVKTKETIQVLNANKIIYQLSFSSNGSYLETSQGILELERFAQCRTRFQLNSKLCLVYVSGQWVRWGTENILWLPPEYRAKCQLVRRNVLAIGHASGRVTFIELDPRNYPPR
jgi:WD40 repeat protein